MTERSIGTHNGTFHADEVLGCFMLKQLPDYKNAKIVRSRDPKVLEKCDIVIDVGGEYSHQKKRYDHHQKSFTETMQSVTGNGETMKLSSAGLVYAHYGREILEAVSPVKLTKHEMELTYHQVYLCLIKEVDAKDNGIDICDGSYRYRINTDLSSRIKRLNPNAFSEGLSEDEQFNLAVEVAGKDFRDISNQVIKSWLPTRKYVEEALENRYKVDKSGRVIEIPIPGIPWMSQVKKLEHEKKITPQILFTIFPDSINGWRVQSVPKDEGFELRAAVLPACTGLRDKELASSCKVDDAFFVHNTGFIGGAHSRAGALKMAQLSLP